MPNMINRTYAHSMVALKSKLLVIKNATNNSEVFDSTCKHFVALKFNLDPLNVVIYFNLLKKVVKVGNKIFVFNDGSSTPVICYDVEKNLWSVDSSEVTRNLDDFSIVNIPSF